MILLPVENISFATEHCEALLNLIVAGHKTKQRRRCWGELGLWEMAEGFCVFETKANYI